MSRYAKMLLSASGQNQNLLSQCDTNAILQTAGWESPLSLKCMGTVFSEHLNSMHLPFMMNLWVAVMFMISSWVVTALLPVVTQCYHDWLLPPGTICHACSWTHRSRIGLFSHVRTCRWFPFLLEDCHPSMEGLPLKPKTIFCTIQCEVCV